MELAEGFAAFQEVIDNGDAGVDFGNPLGGGCGLHLAANVAVVVF